MKLGAHISAAGGLDKTLGRAQAWGAEAAQVFVSSPQRWQPTEIPVGKLAAFAAERQSANLPVFIHAIYLISLGSTNPHYQTASIASLSHAMRVANQMGAVGVITHLGSSKGEESAEVMERVVKNIKETISQAGSGSAKFILENAAGSGHIIGDKFTELGEIMRSVKSDRLAVCLDTAHAYASGYDVSTEAGLETLLQEIDNEIGLDKLVAVHLNDTKVALGGRVDRHAVVGAGLIGEIALARVINHPKLQKAVGLLETPDLDAAAESVKSLEILKELRNG